jgi:hypothetical protein
MGLDPVAILALLSEKVHQIATLEVAKAQQATRIATLEAENAQLREALAAKHRGPSEPQGV